MRAFVTCVAFRNLIKRKEYKIMRVLVSDCDGFYSVVECCRVSILKDAPQYKDKLVVVFDVDSNEQNSICVTKELSHNNISFVNVVVEELYQKGNACFTTSNGFSEYEFFDWDEYDLELDKEVNDVTETVNSTDETEDDVQESNDTTTEDYSSSYDGIYAEMEQPKLSFLEKMSMTLLGKEK